MGEKDCFLTKDRQSGQYLLRACAPPTPVDQEGVLGVKRNTNPRQIDFDKIAVGGNLVVEEFHRCLVDN